MKCDLCDNEATVFLTQMGEGQIQKVNLCPSCYEEKGGKGGSDPVLGELLAWAGLSKPKRVAGGGADHTCPSCGFTLADFQKTLRLGCAGCYAVFREPISAALASMHRGARHLGKAPAARAQLRQVRGELRRIEGELARAVEEERYEEAARLRDELSEVKKGIAGGGSPATPMGPAGPATVQP